MATFGVHSEVGKLRKVIVHRPELSLKRLTPGNHDELLRQEGLYASMWNRQRVAAEAEERLREAKRVEAALARQAAE